MLRIKVTFTGIIAFVEHQRGATVVIPNARRIKGVTHEGTHSHVPSHIPFLEFRSDPPQDGLSLSVETLFSYRTRNQGLFDVVELAPGNIGWLLFFVPGDQGTFTPRPAELHWDNVVDLDRVVDGCAIDDSLVSSFDPRSDRVAARLLIDHGVLTPKPQPDVFATFLPPAEKPYAGRFVQEVDWDVTYENGDICHLAFRPFGVDGDGDHLLTFDGNGPYNISIGNAPFEDIIRRGTGVRDLVDHHFAEYYELLMTPPKVMRLPHRTSERFRRSRSGGGNCPPAKLPLR
jgi:hypothetical protein